MKWLAFICAVGMGAAAQASFELLLVADNGSSTFATRKIHRFDPQSGVYLGSFGGFNADIASTALNKSTNSLFVISGNGTTEWDYNTGDLKNSYTLVGSTAYGFAVRPSGDRMAFFDNYSDFGIGTFPGALMSYGMGNLAGATYRAGVWTSDSTLIAFEATQSRFVNLSYNSGTNTTTITAMSDSVGPTNFSRQIAMSGGSSNVVMASGASGGFYTYAIGGASYFGFSGAVGGTALSAASAHNGFFIGSNQGATGRIDYFDKNNNLTGQFGSGRVLNPISMQTVLAPEPGQWAVMGLGVVALLGRRRRR